MARRVEILTGDTVEALPEPCRSCLYWEFGAPRPDAPLVPAGPARPREREPSSALTRKQAWVSAQVQDGVPPGRVVRVDGEVVGHALFAPSQVFARRPGAAPTMDREALLLATIWVQPHWRGHGLGRLLLQSAIREAVHRHTGAVEAYGDRRWRERCCVLPATWLLHEGFVVHREHPRMPLFRLDVRRTARWAESLEHAWEEVLGRLPRRAPVPVPDGPERVPRPHRSCTDRPGEGARPDSRGAER